MSNLDGRIGAWRSQWKVGKLRDTFNNGVIIPPEDERAYNIFISRNRKVAEAPILFMEMARFEKKMNAQGIKTIFHFCGYSELLRFFKSRYGGVQEVPDILIHSG